MQFPKKLTNKLVQRKDNQSLRRLGEPSNLIDFSSNDYLGLAKSEIIFENTHQFLMENDFKKNGATGSRLLSGNHNLYADVEKQLSKIYHSEATLIFNSGYDANIGFFSSVPQRGDVILYDELIHASIRDGIKLSNAKSYKFKHNNLEDLEMCFERYSGLKQEIYVVTESIFSMDGDSPDLKKMVQLCKNYKALLIVDEAHAVGIYKGGLIKKQNLQNDTFARIVTFGKALGCHGAAVLGSKKLTQYLTNFARSFIYTTGLSPHSLATIKTAYQELNNLVIEKLHKNITHFKAEIKRLELDFIESNSAIHCCIVSGNEKVKEIAQKLQEKGFDVKPILSPTVLKTKERLRFCLHSYNSTKEITVVLELLATFVFK